MKRLLLTLALFLASTGAWAQCNGVFPSLTLCGNNTGSPNIPGQFPSSALVVPPITNANLAQMPAFTFKGNNTNALANPLDLTVAQTKALLTQAVSVIDPTFGAVCNGSTDDTTAIQAAINSLPNDGGVVLFPVANCKISSTLTLGNGTTSALSTKRGVILRGVTNPNTPSGTPTLNGYVTAVGPKLTWAGGAGTMVQINGPLQGWGLQNLILDCASVATTTGLKVVSASFGDSSNLLVQNCGSQGISSTSNPLGGYSGIPLGNADSLRNNWTNINIYVPNVSSASGLFIDGDSAGSSDTDYNVFTNVFIRCAGATGNFGVYHRINDSNTFIDLSVSICATGMAFDYSLNNVFPSANIFLNYEIGGTTPFSNNSTPNAALAPNRFYGLNSANGTLGPTIAGTEAVDGIWRTFTPSPSCGTATFTTNTAKFQAVGKIVSFEFDATITAIGTCSGNTITITLPRTSVSFGAASGIESATTGAAVPCSATSTTVIACRRFDGTLTWGVNNRIVVSGTYEGQ